MSRLPPALRKRLEAELLRGERLLYAGRPTTISTLLGCLPILAFAIFWCSITLPIAAMSWAHLLGLPIALKGKPPSGGMAWFVAIFMIPFVLIGLALLVSIPVSILRSFRTVHAVTDSRILSVVQDVGARTESYAGDRLNFVKRRDGRSGRGSLEIAYGVERDSDGDPRPVTTIWRGIPEVRRAEVAILDLMRRRRP